MMEVTTHSFEKRTLAIHLIPSTERGSHPSFKEGSGHPFLFFFLEGTGKPPHPFLLRRDLLPQREVGIPILKKEVAIHSFLKEAVALFSLQEPDGHLAPANIYYITIYYIISY